MNKRKRKKIEQGKGYTKIIDGKVQKFKNYQEEYNFIKQRCRKIYSKLNSKSLLAQKIISEVLTSSVYNIDYGEQLLK